MRLSCASQASRVTGASENYVLLHATLIRLGVNPGDALDYLV